MTHRIISNLFHAERTFARHKLTVRGKSPAQALGIRYERSVGKALEPLVSAKGLKIEHNPWFDFTDAFGIGSCCPDYLIIHEDCALVVEVKYTFVADAMHKLCDLYIPVIDNATPFCLHPLVIVKNLIPGAPKAHFTIGKALEQRYPLLQWLGTGSIQW